ncbi:ComF family protein [Pontimicrobium aquaticum]|uniref:ComF family protein n=1 Tax=Pontimicrobium aquaticum TaxID=2565367 RepID=A0A4U0F0V9_9FLAO|nr:ComF family protein [Pontimicrobium aquaticum]
MVKNLLNLFFPKVCYACNNLLVDKETYVCTDCRHNLPVTNYHFNNDDTVKKVLYGRVKLEHATALLRFHKKGMVQQLMHGLKYRGYQDIGEFLGKWLGHELKNIEAYKNIDAIVPVPLHKKKLKKRGYNQVEKFGKEIANALDIPYIDTVLKKTTATQTQVFKKRIARWGNDNEVFSSAKLDVLANKHILLVDDIITTGATVEACANELLKANNVKLSLATMAIA